MADNKKKYDAEQIQVLEGLEPVRKRPGMYIGSTDERGLHHLIYEIVDNSVDEALAGFCKNIDVIIHKDNSVEITDDGRGMPVDEHPQMKVPAVEVIHTKLHAGGKFGGGGYKVSGGLHGVGASVVNALSEKMEVQISRDGEIYKQTYSKGEVTSKLKKVGKSKTTGSKTIFKPDTTIFETDNFDYFIVEHRLRETAFLTKGVRFTLTDERNDKKNEFHYEGGIKEFVEYQNKTKEAIHNNVIYFEVEKSNMVCEVALQWTDRYNETILAYANNIHTIEGGTHMVGLRSALTRVFNDYAKKQNFLKDGEDSLSGEDVREGLTAVISVKLSEPQFEGQTKSKLGNSEMRTFVEGITNEKLTAYLEEHPREAKAIIEKAISAARAREAARKAREVSRKQSKLDGLTLPGKLADCSSKNPDECEIFIVEGDSAGGSAKMGRDRIRQAILPLRGKILNVEKARLDKMLSSEEIKNMITAFGTGIGDDFDPEKLRYHKIIIMTDADVDGAHIRTLLLTFFFRYMPALIDGGYVYFAQPPLYQVKQGKKDPIYTYSEPEQEKLVSKLNPDGNTKLDIQRYKGLGEMDATQLWDTTMAFEQRTLVQVTCEDAAAADETFSMLMGDKVPPRRQFIEENAKYVHNLDI